MLVIVDAVERQKTEVAGVVFVLEAAAVDEMVGQTK